MIAGNSLYSIWLIGWLATFAAYTQTDTWRITIFYFDQRIDRSNALKSLHLSPLLQFMYISNLNLTINSYLVARADPHSIFE